MDPAFLLSQEAPHRPAPVAHDAAVVPLKSSSVIGWAKAGLRLTPLLSKIQDVEGAMNSSSGSRSLESLWFLAATGEGYLGGPSCLAQRLAGRYGPGRQLRPGDSSGTQAGPEQAIEELALPEAEGEAPGELREVGLQTFGGDAVMGAPEHSLDVGHKHVHPGGRVLLGAGLGGPYLHWVLLAEGTIGGEVVAPDGEAGRRKGRGRGRKVRALDPLHHPHAAEEGPLPVVQAHPIRTGLLPEAPLPVVPSLFLVPK